ncbi:MAG: ornithine carbamoyltransferase [Nitrospinota bacterium]|nr:ornithine carbamoyltransferase [Nitrospinota bacterium]
MKRDLRRLLDLGREDVEWVIRAASRLKADRKAGRPSKPLEGMSLGMIFQKPSTRTRVSFEVGMVQLGGHTVVLAGDQIQMSRGETVADSARIFSRYLDALAIRTFAQEQVDELAAMADIPVINMLTDKYHPCQVLADLFTIYEKRGSLAGVKVAYVGDGNNMANSWLNAAGMMGFDLRVATPKEYEPDTETVESALSHAKESGASIELLDDPKKAVASANVIYTDTWVSMGQDEEAKKRLADFAGWQVDQALVSLAAEDAIVMHCLPAHRGEEISAEVMDGSQSVVWDQAENRLHAQKAILILLIREDAKKLFL